MEEMLHNGSFWIAWQMNKGVERQEMGDMLHNGTFRGVKTLDEGEVEGEMEAGRNVDWVEMGRKYGVAWSALSPNSRSTDVHVDHRDD